MRRHIKEFSNEAHLVVMSPSVKGLISFAAGRRFRPSGQLGVLQKRPRSHHARKSLAPPSVGLVSVSSEIWPHTVTVHDCSHLGLLEEQP